jgi:RNA polymerase sigma factor (sigma-70 family)
MRTDDAQATFVDCLDRHRGILVKVAGACCRDASGREDLIAEIVAQLWRAYGRFDERAAFSSWMYRIAVNVAISFHRTEARKAGNVGPAEAAILETLASPAEAQSDDAIAQVREFIEELDALNRALMLLYLDDNSYAEIAAILGISETNVATRSAESNSASSATSPRTTNSSQRRTPWNSRNSKHCGTRAIGSSRQALASTGCS